MAEKKQQVTHQVTINDGVSVTVHAIRELLMEYYKQSCVQRLTTSNVRLQAVCHGWNHHFERDELERRNEQLLVIGDIPVMGLWQQPDLLSFHSTLNRSRSLRSVKEGVEAFLAKYLPGIATEETEYGTRTGWQSDRKLILSNAEQPLKAEKRYQVGRISDALDYHPLYGDAPNGNTFRDGRETYYRVRGHWVLEVPEQRIDQNTL